MNSLPLQNDLPVRHDPWSCPSLSLSQLGLLYDVGSDNHCVSMSILLSARVCLVHAPYGTLLLIFKISWLWQWDDVVHLGISRTELKLDEVKIKIMCQRVWWLQSLKIADLWSSVVPYLFKWCHVVIDSSFSISFCDLLNYYATLLHFVHTPTPARLNDYILTLYFNSLFDGGNSLLLRPAWTEWQ